MTAYSKADAATHIVKAPAKSNFACRALVRMLGYQYHNSASATPPAGTLIQNTQRHDALSAITPPTIGPSTPESVNPAVMAPSHFARSAGGHSPAMIIQMLPMTPADPMP